MRNVALLIVAGLSLCAHAAEIKTSPSFDNAEQVVNQFPVETALLNIYTMGSSRTLSAIVYGHKESIEVKVTPKGAMVFENKPVQGAEQSFTYRYDDEVIKESVGINYFTPDPLTFYGLTNLSGDYSVATQTTVIPKIASIGDSSKFITEHVYADSNKKTPVDLFSQFWSLSRASPNTAWLCIYTSKNLLLDVFDNDDIYSECYQTNALGDILQSKKSIQYLAENSVETINYISE